MSWQDIKNFLGYTIGVWGIVGWFVFASLAAGIQLLASYYISYWTEQPLEE